MTDDSKSDDYASTESIPLLVLIFLKSNSPLNLVENLQRSY